MNIRNVMLMSTTALMISLASPAFGQSSESAAPAQDDVASEAAPASEGEEITVIGSRGKARTDIDRPVPVDVVSAQELTTTGQTDLGQQVQFTSPSFNSSKFGVNGATNFADPASLRGLAPDQVLLLINGRRRHQFSALNLNVSPGLGTVVSDLNSIPTAAVERIEVLRDGAAAQYGSDAIAGIINLALKDDDEGGAVGLTAGINSAGDGFTFKGSINQGLKLGSNGGFLNYTLEYFSTEGTNRSDTYDGVLYPATPANFATTGPTPDFPYLTANPRADRGVFPQGPFVVGNYGSNRNRTYQGFLNSEVPLGDTVKAFLFGGYSRKDIRAFGFFRAPATRANAVLSIFPDGYVPILPGRSIDYSINGGLKAELNGWDVELAYGFGQNYLDQFARNTVNASLGAASPTSFYVGRSLFSQQVAELTGSKDLGAVGGIDSLNLAAGIQWRRDNFEVTRGDPASFAVGPLTASGRTAGSNGRPGFAPADENDISRRNIAAFIDLEADISDALLITTALRYENYSDFGGNLSGKLAARYKISEAVALRGSYNRGFRAPSLAQIGNRVNTSTVQNNQILQTQQISSDDPRLAMLGVPDPKAEISDNFSAGVTGGFGAFTFTVDAFQINIDDRIAITDGVLPANFPAVRALFPGVREIRFFTNQIDTRTRGIDVVATYKVDAGAGQLRMTFAGTHAETKVRRQRATPAALVAGATPANQALPLLGQTAIELIEVAQPRTKILFSTNYEVGGLTLGTRATYFGRVKAFSTGLSPLDSNVKCNAANTRCVQTFGAKSIIDVNATYAFTEDFSLTLGANNLFNVYPDKWNNRRDGFVGEAASYSNGQTPYTRNASQFGFNGAYYYLTANVKF